MKHLKNVRYVLRHKWFVLVECFKRGLYWQGIIHDISKFSLAEFPSYSNKFFSKGKTINSGRSKTGYYDPTADEDFKMAWFHHQKCNKHHWQYWCQPNDDGSIDYLQIPKKYIIEMMCDWIGAGKAQGTHRLDGENPTKHWYTMNKYNMHIHPNSRKQLEKLLEEL